MNVPGPGDVLRLAERGWAAAEQAIGLVPRAADLLRRGDELLTAAAQLVDRAGALVGSVERTAADATDLLRRWDPTLRRLEPMLQTIVGTTSPDEVAAVVKVVNLLPELSDRLSEDILPILTTMDTVSPDLRDLLLVSKELNEMLAAIPGLGRAKRKFEDDQQPGDAPAENSS